MASGSKRQKIKAFIRKPFFSEKGKAVSNDIGNDTPATPLATGSSDISVDKSSSSTRAHKIVVSEPSLQISASGIPTSSGSGFFTHANHFSLNDPVLMDNTTVNIHGVGDRRKAMERLSERIIQGVAHDSSARDPPPRCHPGTRIEINKHIITWFYDEEKEELLIWIYGPVGVGKSAIMQTLAEKLASTKHLGASVFVSRPNGRNDSQRLFITIAYQLAVHIDDYCTFITDRLGRDPELVNKGMEDQFRALIVEPFTEMKIGAGAQPWGILLDGLDELNENRSQRDVIRLITAFVLEHPSAPLLWVIASRPEPHIRDTFNNKMLALAYRKELVPANSNESHLDVQRFLRASLERIQEDFPQTIPKKWPSEEQFANLAAASSGLFAFANTAIRFIEDPRHANPTIRLSRVLSALRSLPTTPSDDQPFAHLDALYTSILTSIPSDVWPTTKRVLGALLYARGEGRRFVLGRFGAISVLLSLDLHVIYASVNGCYSLLNASDPEEAYWKPVTFYHASFGDYLLDSTRSKDFYISIQDIENDLLQSSLDVWRDFQIKCPPIPGLSYQNRWTRYFSAFVPFDNATLTFQYQLLWYIHEALFTFLVEKHDFEKREPFSSEQDKNQCFDLLCELEDATMCLGFQKIKNLPEFFPWLFDLWNVHKEELVSRKVIQDVGLNQVQFCQLGTSPAQMQIVQDKFILREWTYEVGDFGKILAAISQLESRFPHLPVLACGSLGKGCLVFRHQANAADLTHHGLDASILQADIPSWIYFAIPFPHSNFYHNAEHFLRASLEATQVNYALTVPKTWPSKELLKLAGAMSHQPVFGTIAIQFINNSHYGNPVACLDQLIALIDEVDFSDQPFIYVDALYTHILNSISPDIWPTTHQLLGAFVYGTTEPGSALNSPKGVSVVFGIELSVVYTALKDCYPMIQLPPENISLGSSDKFCISLEATRDHIFKLLIGIWQDFKKFCHGPESGYSMWSIYCSQYHSDTDSSNNSLMNDFNLTLFHDTHNAPFLSIWQYGYAKLESKQNQDHIFHVLSQLDFSTICLGLSWWYRSEFIVWLYHLWNKYEKELTDRDLFHVVKFQNFQFDHLEKGYFHMLHCTLDQEMQKVMGDYPKSPEELEECIMGFKKFQQRQPQVLVLIGGCPGGKFALLEYEYAEEDLKERLHQPERGKQKAGDLGYYIFPYPDQV